MDENLGGPQRQKFPYTGNIYLESVIAVLFGFKLDH